MNLFTALASSPNLTQPAPPYDLPVGMTEFQAWADRIIEKAGNFAMRDSLVHALAMELIHSEPKTLFSDEYFVIRLRKVAANQIASQVILDIKTRQAEAAKTQAEATATTEVANEQKN